jgi:signal transduction histidine kinase
MLHSNYSGKSHSLEIIDLVLKSLAQDRLAGLSQILKQIAESVDAYGCILWEAAPGADFEISPPKGHLFVLAYWFPDDNIYAVHDLQLGSITGQAVLKEELQNIRNVSNERRMSNEHPFILKSGIISMCSAPIRFLDETRGAVNLYRKVNQPFSLEEVENIKQYASLVPALYKTIKDEVSFNLIEKVNGILQNAELSAADTPFSKEQVYSVIQGICELVRRRFQCMEVSVFLQDNFELPNCYSLAATTWPWMDKFKKKIYTKMSRGLTAWVLKYAKPIRIFDLAHFRRDKKLIQSHYLNLSWNDSLKIEAAVRLFLQLKPEQALPPISFMAAPIVIGDKVIGVIRCSAATQGPYYFGKSALDLLQIIAGQISHYWNGWVIRREIREENQSWRALINSVGKLNSFVQSELSRDNPDENQIFLQALKVTNSVIPGAEIMDIRLYDPKTKELYFAEVYGKAWKEGTNEEIELRRKRRFAVEGKRPSSAGTFVFQQGILYEIDDVKKDPYYSETFPSTKQMLIVPIKVEKNIFGVLDIRGTSKWNFPKQTKVIAELLGQQLGLYHYLASNITRLKRADTELSYIVKTQNQILEDLNHQLRSPLVQAHARVQFLLKGESNQGTLQTNLLAIRGLCGKAGRVAMGTGLFAALARDEEIRVKLERLTPENIKKLLIELARDNKLLVDPRRSIGFRMDGDSFNVLASQGFYADQYLLEQALNNVLDNAFKYSYKGSFITIYGNLTGKDRFSLSVQNKGIPIKSEDAKKCLERGWRSNSAAWTTGEGSGIGLWIVHNIMKAHGGELIIIPTTPDGITEIKLIFPKTKESALLMRID